MAEPAGSVGGDTQPVSRIRLRANHTDLATMEGANEAARRAVNAILKRSGSAAPPCTLWPLQEPRVLAPLRWLDWVLFKLGLPHVRVPWPF